MKSYITVLVLLIAFQFVILNATLKADIDGINNLNGWSFNQNDVGSPPALGVDFIEITNGTNQRRSIWFETKQNIAAFSTSFTYQITGGGGFSTNLGGISFIVHNNNDGCSTLSNDAFGFGYGGIDTSAGVTLELNGQIGEVFTGFFRDGVIGSGSESVDPHLPGGDGFTVTIDYDGSLLTVMVDDGVNTPFSKTVFVSPKIATTLGSGEAWVGFGAVTTSNSSTIRQTIRDFQFTSTASFEAGDVNQDGCVDLLDVGPFVDAITNGQFVAEADVNGDGVVDLLDVAPFVELLTG